MYSIEPAYLVYNELVNKLMEASRRKENQWFFTSAAFSPESCLDLTADTGKHENFVVIERKEIIAYFTACWDKALNVLDGFSIIFFNENKSLVATKALFQYLDYVFIVRGCNVLSWLVAEKNEKALNIYRRFVKHYCGREIGKKTRGQKGYSGEISDIIFFEITKEQYINCKNRG